MGGLGLIAAVLLLERNLAQVPDNKHRKQDVLIYFGLSWIISLFFANLLNWLIFDPPPNPLPIVDTIRFYGLTFYWGLIAFLLVTAIFLKIAKYQVNIYLNELIPSITIFHAFGRAGCSFVGCCFGSEITVKILNLPRFPARELEAVFLFILTALFMVRLKKDRVMYYLLSYPVLRFMLEFFRGDNRGQLFTQILSPSQEISIALFVLGLYLLWRRSGDTKNGRLSQIKKLQISASAILG